MANLEDSPAPTGKTCFQIWFKHPSISHLGPGVWGGMESRFQLISALELYCYLILAVLTEVQFDRFTYRLQTNLWYLNLSRVWQYTPNKSKKWFSPQLFSNTNWLRIKYVLEGKADTLSHWIQLSGFIRIVLVLKVRRISISEIK